MSAVTFTVAIPFPLPEPEMFAQVAAPNDVHAQPAGAATDTTAVPPETVKLSDVGVTV